MHNFKNISAATTSKTIFPRQQSHEFVTYDENRRLKLQLRETQQELKNVKKQLLRVYEENIHLKERGNDEEFVQQCSNEILRLKKLVGELMETKSIGPSEREEIKDRIIMRLEDELISTKIALKEAKNKN